MAVTAEAGGAALRVRVGHDIVDAAQPAAVTAAVEASNREERVAGLPDALNPGIIDPAKAAALLAALRNMPPTALAPLGDRALYLNAPGLQIGATAPTTPASFNQPFHLEVQEVQNETVLARATVAVDCDLARAQAAQARSRLAEADQQVNSLENAGGTDHAALVALSDAQARRFAIAQAWRDNATAVVQCDDGAAAAKADLAAAEQAVQATLVAPHTGMP